MPNDAPISSLAAAARNIKISTPKKREEKASSLQAKYNLISSVNHSQTPASRKNKDDDRNCSSRNPKAATKQKPRSRTGSVTDERRKETDTRTSSKGKQKRTQQRQTSLRDGVNNPKGAHCGRNRDTHAQVGTPRSNRKNSHTGNDRNGRRNNIDSNNGKVIDVNASKRLIGHALGKNMQHGRQKDQHQRNNDRVSGGSTRHQTNRNRKSNSSYKPEKVQEVAPQKTEEDEAPRPRLIQQSEYSGIVQKHEMTRWAEDSDDDDY